MQRYYYIYILTTQSNHVLYIGVTNDLLRRVWEHRQRPVGFVKKYHLCKLVYYEQCMDIKDAIAREKQLKHWNREWKIKLIEEQNPLWDDLYVPMCG